MQKGCPKCGRLIDASYQKCPYCNYDFSNMNNYFKQVETKIIEENKYAGFIKRLIAGIIDLDITTIITSLIMLPIQTITNLKLIQSLFIIIPLAIIIYILYNAALERTRWQGTIGKKIVGIEVTDEYENTETFLSALIRNIVKFLNIFTLGLGFLMCGLNQTKQTLGDKITRNYVLSTINFTEEKTFEFGNPLKRLIAYVIDITILLTIIGLLIIVLKNVKENIADIPELISNLLEWIVIILSLVISFFYFPLYESTRGRTPGKKLMRLKLTDIEGSNISFQRAFIRQFIAIIDLETLGFLLVFTNKKKQTLKDKIMKTIVIDY